MAIQVDAVYENGVLKPPHPLDLNYFVSADKVLGEVAAREGLAVIGPNAP